MSRASRLPKSTSRSSQLGSRNGKIIHEFQFCQYFALREIKRKSDVKKSLAIYCSPFEFVKLFSDRKLAGMCRYPQGHE